MKRNESDLSPVSEVYLCFCPPSLLVPLSRLSNLLPTPLPSLIYTGAGAESATCPVPHTTLFRSREEQGRRSSPSLSLTLTLTTHTHKL